LNRLKSIPLYVLLLASGLVAADAPARKIVQHDNPEYPEVAARMSIRGTVKLRVWITPEGSVRRLEYIGGHPVLAESALKSVKGWKFEPSAKETSEIVEVKF
jgi:TonB family protein